MCACFIAVLQLYLARYEHLPLQLSRSSCQPLSLQELLGLADSEMQQQWQQLVLGYPPNVGSLQLRQVRMAGRAKAKAISVQRSFVVCSRCAACHC
jgi:hypothetical protein